MVSEGMERVIELLKKQEEEAIKKRVKDSRAAMVMLGKMDKIDEDVSIIDVDVNGIPAVWISVPDVEVNNVVLYFHGGGYFEGTINTHKGLAARICRASKSRVLLPAYRLAPENCYPAALEDGVKAYGWLIEKEGLSPENIVIGGDSAGGGLTAATLVKLRDTGIALPAAAFLLSPWTDLDVTGESMRTKKKEDPFIKIDSVFWMAALYCKDEDPRNPYISPLYADLKGLPPLLIQVGSAELLLDDSTRFAEKAKKAGVDVTLEIWEDMIHVFQAFALWAPEGQQGIDKIGEFIKSKT